MKGLVFLMLVLVVQVSIAKPTPPVFHAHDGRTHQHSLPVQGVGHRHGNGAPGILARATNNVPNIPSSVTGAVTSSVIYDATENGRQPTITSTIGNTRQTQNYTINHAASSARNYTKGATGCSRGSPDCNVCASNVQQQFRRATVGQLKWRTQSWNFTWAKKYPPYGTRPLDVFDGKPAYPLGIPNKHIQGFARTNSDRFPFVGTHSNKRKGGVFVVSQNGSRKNLSSLQKSKHGQPV